MNRTRISPALRLSASILLTLFGLLLATFLIARVVPIDPVLAVVGDRASAETYQRVRQELGLDQPLYVQFWRYLVMVLHGDFGRSVLTRNLVIDDIA
ncbi:MAG TPA: ABC transporter permease, partial [Stellaceae bacterium]|nr:ABC transporter permease [Stellaceae bacterium]